MYLHCCVEWDWDDLELICEYKYSVEASTHRNNLIKIPNVEGALLPIKLLSMLLLIPMEKKANSVKFEQDNLWTTTQRKRCL